MAWWLRRTRRHNFKSPMVARSSRAIGKVFETFRVLYVLAFPAGTRAPRGQAQDSVWPRRQCSLGPPGVEVRGRTSGRTRGNVTAVGGCRQQYISHLRVSSC
jgi:hypothetical protein